MKRLKAAIIGQGRSGRDIHGAFLKTEENIHFQVAAVAEVNEARRGFGTKRLAVPQRQDARLSP